MSTVTRGHRPDLPQGARRAFASYLDLDGLPWVESAGEGDRWTFDDGSFLGQPCALDVRVTRDTVRVRAKMRSSATFGQLFPGTPASLPPLPGGGPRAVMPADIRLADEGTWVLAFGPESELEETAAGDEHGFGREQVRAQLADGDARLPVGEEGFAAAVLFGGQLDLGLASVLPGLDELPALAGRVRFDGGEPYFALETPPPPLPPIDGLGPIHLTARLEWPLVGGPVPTPAVLVVGGKVDLGDEDGTAAGAPKTPRELSLEGAWPLGSGAPVVISGSYKGSLADLPLAELGLPPLPDAAIDIDVDLELAERDGSWKPQHLSLETSVGRIEVIENFLSLDQVRLEASTTLSSPRLAEASLEATATLGDDGPQLTCAGAYPSGDLWMRLEAGSTSLEKLKTALGLDVDLDAAPSGSADLTVRCNTLSKGWSIRLDFADEWELVGEQPGPKVILEGVQLAVSRASARAPVVFGLQARAAVGGIELQVAGVYRSGGWGLSGRLESRGGTVGELLEQLGAEVPDGLGDVVVESVEIEVDTLESRCSFDLSVTLPDSAIRARVALETSRDPGEKASPTPTSRAKDGGRKGAAWSVVVYVLLDDLILTAELSEELCLATLEPGEQTWIDVARLAPDDLRPWIPSVEVQVNEVRMGMLRPTSPPSGATHSGARPTVSRGGRKKTTSLYACSVTANADLCLDRLPLVGGMIPGGDELGLRDLTAVLVSGDLDSDKVEKLGLPAAVLSGTQAGRPLTKGLHLAGRFVLGGEPVPLALPVRGRSRGGRAGATKGRRGHRPGAGRSPAGSRPALDHGTDTAATVPASEPAADLPADSTKWFAVGRSIGPFALHRVGLDFRAPKLRIALDAALAFGPLKLSLLGLYAESGLDRFDPEFGLDGLAAAWDQPPLTIRGAFLRIGDDRYAGEALIQTRAFALKAMGSYAVVDGKTSVFLYAVLDQPIGGPPFFFVEGLAAGFGYNREVRVPHVGDVASFPLVSQVMGPGKSKVRGRPGAPLADRIRDRLASLDTHLVPREGAHFGAFGVKFNSFRLVDCFALGIVSFGRSLRLDVLGLAEASLPPKVSKPLARLRMGFHVSVDPERGVLSVEAQLGSGSYLFSPDCQLTGGYAFYAWTKGAHAGDFVNTLGGYHPNFQVPAHYPRVPPLGFSWNYSRELSIKGSCYLALTPGELMAGGRLEAHYRSGALQASFTIRADFRIGWKPLFYEGRAYVRASVSLAMWWWTLRGEFGATLSLSGPPLSGSATVNLGITSATIRFGDSVRRPGPIGASEFRQSFLPAPEEIAGVKIVGGAIRCVEDAGAGDERWIVDPEKLVIETFAAAPVDRFVLGADAEGTLAWHADDPSGGNPRPGSIQVKPMASELRRSEHRVEITGGMSLRARRVSKGFPRAMWTDGATKPDLFPAACGLVIRPAAAALGDATDFDGKRLDPDHDDGAPDGGGDAEGPPVDEVLPVIRPSCRPSLPPGDYTLTVTHELELGWGSGDKLTSKSSLRFSVGGERFALGDGDVHALYPPRGDVGPHQDSLPHVMLDRAGLPWERTALAGAGRGDGEPAPWLALLLFTGYEAPEVQRLKVGDLVARGPAGDDTPRSPDFPPTTLQGAQSREDPVDVIDVDRDLLLERLPTYGQLGQFVHVRGANSKSGEDLSGMRAVVLGSAMPLPDTECVAHLVSVEGRYGPSHDPKFQIADGAEQVRLVSLRHWSFTCATDGGTLSAAVRKLNHSTLHLEDSPSTRAAAVRGRKRTPARVPGTCASPAIRVRGARCARATGGPSPPGRSPRRMSSCPPRVSRASCPPRTRTGQTSPWRSPGSWAARRRSRTRSSPWTSSAGSGPGRPSDTGARRRIAPGRSRTTPRGPATGACPPTSRTGSSG